MTRNTAPILSDEFDADSIVDPATNPPDWRGFIESSVSDDPFEIEWDELEPGPLY